MWMLLTQLAIGAEVPLDYATIADAPDGEPPGATIDVSAGVYVEDLVVTKEVILRSTDGL